MKGDGFVYVEPAENDQCEPCILLKNLDNINDFINKYINDFKNKLK